MALDSLQRSALLVVFLASFHYLCSCETVCSSATAVGNRTGCIPIDEVNVCRPRDAEECPVSASPQVNLHIDLLLRGKNRALRPTNATTDMQLSLTPVTHNFREYNLTVSWESLNQTTVPAGATFELRLFDGATLYRRICSPVTQTSDGPPIWTTASFDGLGIDKNIAQDGPVELIVFGVNGSMLIVMSTPFTFPTRCLDIIPVSPYRCIEQGHELRTLPVANLSHSLTQEEGGYRVRLSWQKNSEIETYKIPQTYFIRVYKSNISFASFHTDQTEISIWPLEPTREYFIRVQPFMPCSRDCGEGDLQIILSKPSSAPTVTYLFSLSSSEIKVVWNEIAESDTNGFITHYEIRYTAANESTGYQFANTTNLSFTLSGLRELTRYQVQVRAYTSVGAGPYSQALYNETLPPTLSPTLTDITPTPAPTLTDITPTPALLNTTHDHTSIHVVTVSAIVPSTVLVFALTVTVFVVAVLLVARKAKRSEILNFAAPRTDMPEMQVVISDMRSKEPGTIMELSSYRSRVTRSSSSELSATMSYTEEAAQEESDSQSVRISCSMSTHVDVLLVVSRRCPQRRLIYDTLAETLTQRRNESGVRIKMHFPGLDGGDFVRLSAPLYLEKVVSQSRDLCFLCVVTKEFDEEWSGKDQTPDSLVYSVSHHLTGKLNHSKDDISKRVLLLYEKEDDLKYVPDSLKVCKPCSLNDSGCIAGYVFRQPEMSLYA